MSQVSDKLSSYFKKNNMMNLLIVLIIIIILVLLVRLFIFPETYLNTKIEHFTQKLENNAIFGNQINFDMSSDNNKVYKFKFDDVMLLDSIVLDTRNAVINTETLPGVPAITSTTTTSAGQEITPSGSTTTTKPVLLGIRPLIQFLDTENNLKDIKNNGVNLINLKDVNNNSIFTDTVIISYPIVFNINKIEFYGSRLSSISRESYNNILPNLSGKKGVGYNNNFSINNSNKSDHVIYSISLNVRPQGNNFVKPSGGVTSIKYNIYYYNNVYPGTKFAVSNDFYLRIDNLSNFNQTGTTLVNAFLYKPIIANNIIVEFDSSSQYKFTVVNINVQSREASSQEITKFKIDNQYNVDDTSAESTNYCPTMDQIVDKQVKAQQVCDTIEYQDKIKTEKIKLERNRQYLLKLKAQQEQIDELNDLINNLQNRRNTRDQNTDMLRVAQYQKQREEASMVRDLANERLQSQDNNKLFFNVNINPSSEMTL